MSRDDSVRGNGTSYLSLDALPPKSAEHPFDDSIVKFHGNLDHESLGDAGFASQRTVDETGPSSIFPHTTKLELEIPYTDGKKHMFNIKDTVPPAGTNDRASVSWGYDFQLLATTQTEYGSVSADLQRVVVPIKDLVPTFNGRLVNKSALLNVTGIKRLSIMIRSFFAEQRGAFEPQIKSVVARNFGESQL